MPTSRLIVQSVRSSCEGKRAATTETELEQRGPKAQRITTATPSRAPSLSTTLQDTCGHARRCLARDLDLLSEGGAATPCSTVLGSDQYVGAQGEEQSEARLYEVMFHASACQGSAEADGPHAGEAARPGGRAREAAALGRANRAGFELSSMF